MSNSWLERSLKDASLEVSTWPEWKKAAYRVISNNSVPRMEPKYWCLKAEYWPNGSVKGYSKVGNGAITMEVAFEIQRRTGADAIVPTHLMEQLTKELSETWH